MNQASEPQVSSIYINHYLRYAQEQGIDLTIFNTRNKDKQGQDYWPFESLKELIELLKQQGCPESIGLEVSKSILVSSHGHLGFGLSHASNLQEVLELVTQYYATRAQFLIFSITKNDDEWIFEVTPSCDWEPVFNSLTESVAGLLLNIIRYAIGNLAQQCRLALPFPKPDWDKLYEGHFPPDIEYGKPSLRIYVPTSLLDVPCLAADPNTLSMAKELCEAELERLANLYGITDKLTSLIEHQNAYDLTVERAAEQLHMSKSTLIRKLNAENQSFKHIMEGLKKRHAVRLLRQTETKLDAIALQLGYEDVSNFSRSFKRWFGCSPSTYRHENK